MPFAAELRGCSIIELDINGEVLWSWLFPTITTEQKQFVQRKFDDLRCQPPNFVFTKFLNDWCYIITVKVLETDCLPQVEQFALIVWAEDYHPEKYEHFCKLLSVNYRKTGDAAVVLRLYLSVMTQRPWSTEENGTFIMTDNEFTSRFANTNIKDLIKTFGLEIILLYTALLLNKKVFIYHHSLETLLEWVMTFPHMMVHRDFSRTTFPWVHLVPDELRQLEVCDGYIAGCADSSICGRTDLFDLLVNLAASEVTVAPHTRESFVMTKTHKDIALFLVQLSENPAITEREVISEITNKTKELLELLRSFAVTTTPDGRKLISLETLRERNLAPALENFLFQLSVAENMIML